MILSAIDLDSLFPLLIGLIWVIAQIAGAGAKKKKKAAPRPSPVRRPDGETSEDPFADFMRRLGGVQEFELPRPPEPEPAAEAPPPPRSEPIPAAAPLPPRAVPAQDAATALRLRPDKVPDADVRPTMRSFKTAMPAMKIPAMKLSFQTSEKKGSGVPKVGKIIAPKDQQTLRRAVLGHIILSKPKALEGWSTGTVE